METTQTTSPSSQSGAQTNLVSKWHQIPSRRKLLIVIDTILVLVIVGAIIYEIIVTNQRNKQLQLQYQTEQQQQQQQILTDLQNSKSKPVTTAAQKKIISELQKTKTTSAQADQQAILKQLQAQQAANYQSWKNAQSQPTN